MAGALCRPCKGPLPAHHRTELLSDVGLVERAAAIGADLGQRRLVDLADLFGGRRLAVGLGAVILARPSSGLPGVRLGIALGEGPGLALAGAGGLVELAAEALVLGLQVLNPSLKSLAVGTPDRFHVGIIRSSGTCRGAGGRQETVQLVLPALIKYRQSTYSVLNRTCRPDRP